MGKRYKDPGVRCPYYCSEEPSKIYCEGPSEENWIHRAWGDEKKKKAFKKRVCRGDYHSCMIAAALDREKGE